MSKCSHGSWFCATCGQRHCDPARGSGCGCPFIRGATLRFITVPCQMSGCMEGTPAPDNPRNREITWLCEAHRFPKKEDNMDKYEATVKSAQAALDRALAAQAEAALKVERFPDIHDEGSILTWTKTFAIGGPAYTFAAVRAGGLWYVTGKWQTGMLWSPFVDKFLADADQVWCVTTLEEI